MTFNSIDTLLHDVLLCIVDQVHSGIINKLPLQSRSIFNKLVYNECFSFWSRVILIQHFLRVCIYTHIQYNRCSIRWSLRMILPSKHATKTFPSSLYLLAAQWRYKPIASLIRQGGPNVQHAQFQWFWCWVKGQHNFYIINRTVWSVLYGYTIPTILTFINQN